MNEDKYSDTRMEVRQQALSILLKNFDNNKAIYECADDWCGRFKTTAGLVKYYETYYNNAK